MDEDGIKSLRVMLSGEISKDIKRNIEKQERKHVKFEI